jgi:hypothetical protein|tara:strand:+ start:419 stop:631 length:213 start_codon:yes stop_codon:yes gene_type:complete
MFKHHRHNKIIKNKQVEDNSKTEHKPRPKFKFNISNIFRKKNKKTILHENLKKKQRRYKCQIHQRVRNRT